MSVFRLFRVNIELIYSLIEEEQNLREKNQVMRKNMSLFLLFLVKQLIVIHFKSLSKKLSFGCVFVILLTFELSPCLEQALFCNKELAVDRLAHIS